MDLQLADHLSTLAFGACGAACRKGSSMTVVVVYW
jgi:hypothetical protein